MKKIELKGGRDGKIFKKSETVIRPSNYWTPTVHRFLNFLELEGVDFVPKAIKFDKKEEVLTFISGEAFNSPYPKEIYSLQTLKSAARLLKLFHKFSAAYLSEISTDDRWMLDPKREYEVICHGDFAPYNVCVQNWNATGIIDFDTIHPGPRLWDVSYAVYRWVPLASPRNPDTVFDLIEQIHRARIFLDIYGTKQEERLNFVSVLLDRLKALISYMKAHDSYTAHLDTYEDDIQYLSKHKSEISSGLG